MNAAIPGRSGPPVAFILIGITVLAYFIQMGSFEPIMVNFALWPPNHPYFAPWQVISYGFLHGGLGHLFFNMFALYMFGLPIERAWGAKRFLIFYFVCMVGGALCQLLVTYLAGSPAPTIGASGAVFGLLLAFGMLYPNSMIMLLIPPIPMKAKYFVVIYGALTLVLGLTGSMPGVAHFAHLGGMLFGLGLILFWGRQDYRRRRRF